MLVYIINSGFKLCKCSNSDSFLLFNLYVKESLTCSFFCSDCELHFPPILLRFWLSALKGKPIPLKTTQRRRALRQTEDGPASVYWHRLGLFWLMQRYFAPNVKPALWRMTSGRLSFISWRMASPYYQNRLSGVYVCFSFSIRTGRRMFFLENTFS